LGVTQRYTEKREIHGGLWVVGWRLGVTQRYTEKREIHGGLWVVGFGEFLIRDFELTTYNKPSLF
jgi:hypothetical protein